MTDDDIICFIMQNKSFEESLRFNEKHEKGRMTQHAALKCQITTYSCSQLPYVCSRKQQKKHIHLLYIHYFFVLVGDVAIYNSKESKPEFYILTKRM